MFSVLLFRDGYFDAQPNFETLKLTKASSFSTSDYEIMQWFNIKHLDCVLRFNYLWFITRIALIWHQYLMSCQVVENQQETCLLKCYNIFTL